MHEEVSDKTVNLAVRTGKVTVRGLIKALSLYVKHLKNRVEKLEMEKNTPVEGQQSVKDLIKQGQGVSSAEIGDEGIRDFKKIANKYGVDFAIVKDKAVDPPVYTVFFKAKDADAITQVLKDYSASQIKRRDDVKKPSVIQKLKEFKELVAKTPRKEKEKRKEQER
ncbi:MAG: PcfB family protein [Bacteroidaceae bacterium]|nr:PcfB family protein [Bacteroidaceae bacterium]